jgi:hypothetical protein
MRHSPALSASSRAFTLPPLQRRVAKHGLDVILFVAEAVPIAGCYANADQSTGPGT